MSIAILEQEIDTHMAEPFRRLNVDLDAADHQFLRVQAAQLGVSHSSLVRALLRCWQDDPGLQAVVEKVAGEIERDYRARRGEHKRGKGRDSPS